MRSVNLIPPEDRRGDKAPMRAGGASYVLLGGLAALFLAVAVTAMTSKSISDKRSEKQGLEQELAAVTAEAEGLQSFISFRAVQETRQATITSLAQSRFDWERVLREVALVIPSDVWLINLTGTVSPAVSLDEGADIITRDSVPGPALELVGCAPGQDAVAGLVAALEDIDGVTRVGLSSAEKSSSEGGDTAAPAGGSSDDDCRTREFISKFEIVVAFDEVPVPAAATAPAVPAPAAPAPATGGAPAQPAGAAGSTAAQTGEAEQAANVVPGG